MIKNFSVRHVSTLIVHNYEVDLHNDLDFYKIAISMALGVIEVEGRPSEVAEKRCYIKFTFSGVRRSLISYSSTSQPGNEFAALSHVGYIPSANFGKVEPFLLEENFTEDSTIVFYFEDGSYISVDAHAADATVYDSREIVSRIK